MRGWKTTVRENINRKCDTLLICTGVIMRTYLSTCNKFICSLINYLRCFNTLTCSCWYLLELGLEIFVGSWLVLVKTKGAVQ